MSQRVRCITVQGLSGILIVDEARGSAMLYTRSDDRGLQIIPIRQRVRVSLEETSDDNTS